MALLRVGKTVAIETHQALADRIRRYTELRIELGLKNLLQSSAWVLAKHHLLHAGAQRAEHRIRRYQIPQVLRQRRIVRRNKHLRVGFEQSVIQVKQQCDRHGGPMHIDAVTASFLYNEFGRQRAAFSAADFRLVHITPGFLATGLDLHPLLKAGAQRSLHLRAQSQEFAGVGPQQVWHRAGRTQG